MLYPDWILRLENEKLIQEAKEVQQELANLESQLPQKVTPITKASGKTNKIPESIHHKLESLEVKLNPSLTKLIAASDEQEVIKALLSVEQYIQHNEVKSIGGLAVQAIKEKWSPSASLQKPTSKNIEVHPVVKILSYADDNRELLSLTELSEISNIFRDNSHD